MARKLKRRKSSKFQMPDIQTLIDGVSPTGERIFEIVGTNEHGETVYMMPTIERLCRLYGVPYDPDNPPPPGKPAPMWALRSDEAYERWVLSGEGGK